MKKIMLAAALIAATFSAAFAERPTKAANDAAMKAGHKALSSKTTELEADLKRNDKTAAEAAAMDILALMRKGVAQTRYDADMMAGAQRETRYKQMLNMENMVHDYMEYTKDMDANGQKVVNQAKTFLTAY